MRGFYCVYIFFIKFNLVFTSFYYFARPHKLQSFNFNGVEIKAVCMSVCLSCLFTVGQICPRDLTKPVNIAVSIRLPRL